MISFLWVLLNLALSVLFISLSMRYWVRLNDWFTLDYSLLHKDLKRLKGDVHYPWEYAFTRYLIGVVLLYLLFPLANLTSFSLLFWIPSVIAIHIIAAYPAALFWHLTSDRIYRKHQSAQSQPEKIIYAPVERQDVDAAVSVAPGKHHHKIAFLLLLVSLLLIIISFYVMTRMSS